MGQTRPKPLYIIASSLPIREKKKTNKKDRLFLSKTMTKSKALQMRLRGRKRYLAFALKEKMDMHKLKEKIEGKINGAAIDGTAYFKIIHDKYNPKKMRGLLLVNNKNASEFIAALHAIGIQTLGTSGILKKAYHKYIE